MTQTNDWLHIQLKRAENLIYQCEDYRLKGSYGGELNLAEVIFIIKGSINEIGRLQMEFDKLKEENNQLKKGQPVVSTP